MTNPEKQKLVEDCYWKLKRATAYAETMLKQSVSIGATSTLMTLASEASAATAALRSIAAGNEPPKEG